jgi:hypothetical protein
VSTDRGWGASLLYIKFGAGTLHSAYPRNGNYAPAGEDLCLKSSGFLFWEGDDAFQSPDLNGGVGEGVSLERSRK